MSIVVVGSVALDTVETPYGKRENALGGSATYFSTAASFFTSDIKMVGIVGKDFPHEHADFLRGRGIDLSGLERVDGKTFHWSGRYGGNLNVAETLSTELNVFEEFAPKLPESYRSAEYVFLANINPELQMDVLRQMRKPKLVVCDTMNLWISERKAQLLQTIQHVDVFVLNDAEARIDSKSREQGGLFAELPVGDRILKVAFVRKRETVFIKTVFPLRKGG